MSDFASMRKLSTDAINTLFINSDVAQSIAKIDGFNIRKAYVVEEIDYYVGLSKEHMQEETRQKFIRAILNLKSNGTIEGIMKSYDLTMSP
jgi:ABC-type amino acid transport substrate-binding protein